MKNKIIKLLIIGLIINIVSSCKKNHSETNSEIQKVENNDGSSWFNRLITDYTLPANANAEARRVFNAVQGPDYEISISHQLTYGQISSAPQYDILLSGRVPNGVNISFNNINYPSTNGGYFFQNTGLNAHYGKNVAIKVNENVYNVYVPNKIMAIKLGTPRSININRTGNFLRWKRDPLNSTGYVALEYYIFDNAVWGSKEGQIDRNIILLNDNGGYDLNGLLSNPKIKRIHFNLISGNAVSHVLPNGKKILLHIDSRDYHEYIIN